MKRVKNANREIGVPRVGWHSRRYLPHFDAAEATQHVTFHLADSVPRSAAVRIESELKIIPEAKRDVERRKRLEGYIDAGYGSCILREPNVAEMVQSSLLTFDSRRYRVMAWVVMPNHVHVLFQPISGWAMAEIVASWKKFTGRRICDALRATNRVGGTPVWHREYWDRYIRDASHMAKAVEYIHQNPVKAGLCAAPEDWPWSSAYSGNADRRIGEVALGQGSRGNLRLA